MATSHYQFPSLGRLDLIRQDPAASEARAVSVLFLFRPSDGRCDYAWVSRSETAISMERWHHRVIAWEMPIILDGEALTMALRHGVLDFDLDCIRAGYTETFDSQSNLCGHYDAVAECAIDAVAEWWEVTALHDHELTGSGAGLWNASDWLADIDDDLLHRIQHAPEAELQTIAVMCEAWAAEDDAVLVGTFDYLRELRDRTQAEASS